MKSDEIRQMLATVYDLEGLLLLADSREDEIPEMIIGKIIGKIGDLSDQAASLHSEPVQPACSDKKAAQTDPIEEEAAERPQEETEETPCEADCADIPGENKPEYAPEEPSAAEEAAPETPASSQTPTQETADNRSTSRLEDILQRNRSKDLRSAFSINDMFRFRRELFGNSAADMTDTINLVDAMTSFAEAEDYFYNDLGWDAESEEVAEFMTIIRNHFL